MDYHLTEDSIDELLGDEFLGDFLQGDRRSNSRFPPWTKEQSYSLILLFKQHPLLYDSTHPKYAQPIHRNKALREMHEKMKASRPGVTIPEMRAKLKTLRSQFMKEKRMMADKGYTPKLWCYDHLTYLDDRGKFLEEEREQEMPIQDPEFHVVEQPDDCYVVENENEIFVKSFYDSDSNERPDPIQSDVSEPRPRSDLYQKCLTLVETLSAQLENGPVKEKASAALLGRMVETELSNFPEEIYDEAKWKIIKVLEEASKKNKQIKIDVDW